MSAKKSIDGFIPSKKSVETRSGGARAGRGIPASELLEDDEGESISGIVPLPAPNGNDLKIKGYDDFVSARGVKKSTPKRTIDDFLTDSMDNGLGVDLEKPTSRTRGRQLDDEDIFDRDDLVADLDDEIEDRRASKRSKRMFWQKDADEDIDESEPGSELDEDLEDDFDIYNERPKQKTAKALDGVAERRASSKNDDVDAQDDTDNDLDVDDEDIERYRSRRFKREKREAFHDESNVVLRVIGGAVIVVVTIIVTYFIFSLFYDAPEPAKVDEGSVVTNTTNTEGQKPEEQPAETPEEPATIAVYNAGTTAGAARQLADELVTQGKDAIVGTVNNGNAVLAGSGHAIFDFTGGKKPKAAAELEALYGVKVTQVDLANLPAEIQTDRDFVIIIR